MIVRLGDDLNAAQATFDVKLERHPKLLCHLRLWVGDPHAPTWLIPTAGERTFLQFGEDGFMLSEQAPFDSEGQWRRGLLKAATFLSVANGGWF